MDFSLTDDQRAIRDALRDICAKFTGAYWREIDATQAYPDRFVETLTQLGWLSILIPEEFGGGGLGILEASLVLEEIHRSGGNANACHAQMYTMGTILRHASEEQKRRYLPELAAGRLRLQAFAITEPDAGSDTTKLRNRAVRIGDRYVLNGQKVFISRVEFSDLMLLLAARTTPIDKVQDRTEGLSVFLVDLRAAGDGIEWQRIPLMFNHHTYTVYFKDASIPADSLIGEEGRGFRYIVDGWNAERILIAAEAIGDGGYFVDRASAYASEREVFGRRVGSNQGVQFPIAQAYAQVEAASLLRFAAATRFDAGEPCAAEANMAKLLASQASWAAANACMTTYGGNGFASEYDVERKFREAKLLEIAPVSNNLVLSYLGHHVLGMPRSF